MRTTHDSVVQPVGDGDVRQYLRQFRPRVIDKAAWQESEARRFMVDSLTAFPFRHEPDLKTVTSSFVQITAYALKQGLPLDLEVVLDPALVEQYLTTLQPSRIAHNRYTLRRLGLALTKDTPWPTRSRKLLDRDQRPYYEPYSDGEISYFAGMVMQQSTTLRYQTGVTLMALGHGAGLRPKEILWAQVGDIEFADDTVLVHVGHPHRRTVPMLRRYHQPIRTVCEGRDPHEYLSGRDASTYTTTALSYQLDDLDLPASEVPIVRPARLRATWVLHHLRVGVPVGDLRLAAGGMPTHGLPQIFEQLTPSPTPEHNALLTGE